MTATDKKIKLLYIMTVPQSLGFISGQVDFMIGKGLDVHTLTSPGKYLEIFKLTEGVKISTVDMPRRITPARDLLALIRMVRELRRIRPTVVHAHTPKGGLLGMISAYLTGVPVRIYHILGLPMMTATGYRRVLLRWSERVACRLAHQVLCVSNSLRSVAIDEGLVPAAKIKVLLSGSISGVDAAGRFDPGRFDQTDRARMRAKYGIPEDSLVVGYVGRIVRDKGLIELAEAWRILCEEFPELHLLVLGDFEPQDPVPDWVARELREHPRVHLADFTRDVPPFYSIMDLVVLPTYREGFGQVLIEGASMGLPTVTTRVPGCVDAVQDGVTGTLVPPYDSVALADAVRTYLCDPERRRRHGTAGRERALRDFKAEAMWEAIYEEYLSMLVDAGITGCSELSPKALKRTSE